MHRLTQSCALFLWMHLLTFVQSQDCTRQEFLNSRRYDSNFDTSGMQASYPSGKQLRVNCVPGYTGFFKMICGEGTWTYIGSKCQPISCGHPGDALFADFRLEIKDDFVFGSQVVYTCHRGYQMISRNNVRHCTAEGWSGVVPVCEALQCPVVRVPNNLRVTGNPEQSGFGHVLRFRCKDNNYALKGPAEIYCEENGRWNRPPPICEEIKCFKPEITNGVVLGDITEYKKGGILNYECNKGYQKSDISSPICIEQQSIGVWSPTPMCEKATCIKDDRNVESWGSHWDKITVDVTLGYTCRTGYKKPPGVNHATCTTQGWSPNPLCEVKICNRRNVPNTDIVSVIKPIYVFNEEVEYVCKGGYEGRFNLRCGDRGWEGRSHCTEKGCERLNIPDAYTSSKWWFTYQPGANVKYRCLNNFMKVLTLECRFGKWIGPQSCSDSAECGSPSVPHGFAVGPYSKKQYYYTCNDGYKLISKGWWGEAQCEDGQWTGLEECTDDKNCGPIPEIPNGNMISERKAYTEGNHVRIRCARGYTAQANYMICRNGKWQSRGLVPHEICKCDGECCSTPPKVANAVVLTSYQKEYPSNFVATYQCLSNFTMVGENQIKCIDGEWNVNNIKCTVPLDCGTPPHVPGGDVKYTVNSTYKHGQRVEYMCQRFYTMKGGPYKTCHDGEWIGDIRCIEPCTVNKELMQTHNIQFTYRTDDDLFIAHDDRVTFFCVRGTPDRVLRMTQYCNEGVIHLPTCQLS